VIEASSTRIAPCTAKLTNQAEVSRIFDEWANQVAGFQQLRFLSTVATLRFRNNSQGRTRVFASSVIVNNTNRLGNYEVPANLNSLEHFVRR
jgi:hypothetical protein